MIYRELPSVQQFSRREAMAMGVGLSVTLLCTAPHAEALRQRKLFVIICRGGMDGLSLLPPIGESNYPIFRGEIAIPVGKALSVDSDFALHPRMINLHRLMQNGQARVAPAVAIPVRNRSHFEAQDLLESGSSHLYDTATGWLNRALLAVQPHMLIRAISIGPQSPRILHGPIQTDSWSPDWSASGDIDRVASVLLELYRDDESLRRALASGLQLRVEVNALDKTKSFANEVQDLVTAAARLLASSGGPSIAVLSLNGFDTHADQGATEGQLASRFAVLDQLIAGIEAGMALRWRDTVVVVVTEFGRTARVNGSKGTDHGTASTLFLAGGAIRPGGIIGDWPTLTSRSLFENRDLAPTLDVRQIFKGILVEHLGIDKQAIETKVFPDSHGAVALRGLIG